MSIGSCLDSCIYIISCLQANFGESFKDTRPWHALYHAIKVAEAVGNSLQVIANFQIQSNSGERKEYHMCELCRVLPVDERLCNLGCYSLRRLVNDACRAANATAHGTSQSTIPSATPTLRGTSRCLVKPSSRGPYKLLLRRYTSDYITGCKCKQPPHCVQYETCDSCRVIHSRTD